jgi:hypothetical protein
MLLTYWTFISWLRLACYLVALTAVSQSVPYLLSFSCYTWKSPQRSHPQFLNMYYKPSSVLEGKFSFRFHLEDRNYSKYSRFGNFLEGGPLNNTIFPFHLCQTVLIATQSERLETISLWEDFYMTPEPSMKYTRQVFLWKLYLFVIFLFVFYFTRQVS